MAKLNTLDLTGASGKVYTFDVYPADTTWKVDIGCVYYISNRVAKQDGTGTHTGIYIGQTACLKTRHVDHHKQQCFERHGYNCISIHLVASEAARLLIETDLVRAIGPPCNG